MRGFYLYEFQGLSDSTAVIIQQDGTVHLWKRIHDDNHFIPSYEDAQLHCRNMLLWPSWCMVRLCGGVLGEHVPSKINGRAAIFQSCCWLYSNNLPTTTYI